MKRTDYIIFVLLFFPLLAGAQPYYTKGQVKDQEGNPLQNVTMLLHSSGYLYRSGQDGGFGIFIPQQTDTLTIFREGYEKEKRVIHSDVFNQILLKKTIVVKSVARKRIS